VKWMLNVRREIERSLLDGLGINWKAEGILK
jgi:hypothetical protein